MTLKVQRSGGYVSGYLRFTPGRPGGCGEIAAVTSPPDKRRGEDTLSSILELLNRDRDRIRGHTSSHELHFHVALARPTCRIEASPTYTLRDTTRFPDVKPEKDWANPAERGPPASKTVDNKPCRQFRRIRIVENTPPI